MPVFSHTSFPTKTHAHSKTALGVVTIGVSSQHELVTLQSSVRSQLQQCRSDTANEVKTINKVLELNLLARLGLSSIIEGFPGSIEPLGSTRPLKWIVNILFQRITKEVFKSLWKTFQLIATREITLVKRAWFHKIEKELSVTSVTSKSLKNNFPIFMWVYINSPLIVSYHM